MPCRHMFDSKVHYRLTQIFHDEIKIFTEPQRFPAMKLCYAVPYCTKFRGSMHFTDATDLAFL